MAQFYASIRGGRGEATRTGSAKSGIRGHVRGWTVGGLVQGWNDGGADLRWANLRRANLSGADLRGANLRRADLLWAHTA